MEDLERFRDSAVYNTQHGKKLLTDNQYSSALYMRLYAHEVFTTFKEAVLNHFSGTKPKCVLNNAY